MNRFQVEMTNDEIDLVISSKFNSISAISQQNLF